MIEDCLLVITQARKVPEFLAATAKLKISKLWMRFYNSDDAFRLAREFFLNSNYKYFIILPDDLIVTQKDIDRIANEPEMYDSISGFCNVTAGTTLNVDACFSRTSPPNPPHLSTYEGYNWVTIKEIEEIRSASGDEIMPVLHQGFALCRLSRKLVEQVPFRTDEGCCVDSCLALDLLHVGIQQFVDLRIRTLHMKIPHSEILVGKEKSVMVFEK